MIDPNIEFDRNEFIECIDQFLAQKTHLVSNKIWINLVMENTKRHL